jgi:hypothetical protein
MSQDPAPEISVIDITHDIDPSAAPFDADPQFFAAAQQRKTEMMDFMTAMKIKTMRTQMVNSAGSLYKVMIDLNLKV